MSIAMTEGGQGRSGPHRCILFDLLLEDSALGVMYHRASAEGWKGRSSEETGVWALSGLCPEYRRENTSESTGPGDGSGQTMGHIGNASSDL